MLNPRQARAAATLRNMRPAVIPGTNVIVSTAARETWYSKVCAAMARTGVTAKHTALFCDIAGVPN